MSNPHSEPYSHGDIHNVEWSNTKHDSHQWNRPMPIPRYVPKEMVGGHIGKGVASGSSEPFGWMDRKYGVARDLLAEHKNDPLTISTRSDLISADEYLQHLNPDLHHVKIHIPTHDDDVARIIEPGAPSVSRRIKAAKILKDKGIPVTIVHDKITGHTDTKDHDIKQMLWNSGLPNVPIEENKPKLSAASRKRMKQLA